jgi:hypothetical protein
VESSDEYQKPENQLSKIGKSADDPAKVERPDLAGCTGIYFWGVKVGLPIHIVRRGDLWVRVGGLKTERPLRGLWDQETGIR